MKWVNKINEWKNGHILNYPSNIKNNFFYETSFITKNMNNEYKEKFITSKKLNNMKQDVNTFKSYFDKSNNKNVVVFYNLSKTCKLIVPKPRKGKNFSTIKHFIDEASIIQQKAFWKKVSLEINKSLKNMNSEHTKLYVSTHGLGISYFHLRLEYDPKYYISKNFI
jgi:ERCC4-related helicase